MNRWGMLWKKPQWAYFLSGLALLVGLGLGWLGMWEKNDTQAKFGCVLGAAFCFALFSLFAGVGTLATYAAEAGQAYRPRDKSADEQ